ncbi:hypothetical protein MNBD_NITROSPINAE04-319 [hydrothermal vent metagenome]|uniref:TNase-like domain-containing protein n=1 Tax=hydrothermal vent metagenome TaxID=652676 RepID=A0A3B1CAK2_9ZZZZ
MDIGKPVLFWLAFALALAPALACYGQAQAPWPPEHGFVVHVYDGDTILVVSGKEKMKIRLLGIDTPEKQGPYTKAEPLGEEAGRRMTELALRKKVTLIYGGDSLKDRYGRYLAHVILPDGRSLNEIMLKEGLAEAYRKFGYTRKKLYRRLEAKAKSACLGIWKLSIKTCGD